MDFPSLKIIKNLNIKPQKSRGQNFLIDANVSRKIIDACRLYPNDTVIEIGPGLGSLTFFLAQKVKRVVAVEIDKNLFQYLNTVAPSDLPIVLVRDDILKIHFADFINKKEKCILVGNIPYSITTPLLMKYFEESPVIKQAVLMIQKDVCKRLYAKPGDDDYGLLAIYTAAYLKISLLFDVSPTCFFPQPKISSAVISIEPAGNRNWLGPGEKLFRHLVTAAFSHRRKTLMNCLKNFITEWNIDEELLKRITIKDDIDLSKRGEMFSREEFDRLTALINHVHPSRH